MSAVLVLVRLRLQEVELQHNHCFHLAGVDTQEVNAGLGELAVLARLQDTETVALDIAM